MELQAGVILFMTKNGEFSPSCPQHNCSMWEGWESSADGPGPRGRLGRGTELSQVPSAPHPSQADDPSGLCFLVKYRKGWTKRALPAQTRMTPTRGPC